MNRNEKLEIIMNGTNNRMKGGCLQIEQMKEYGKSSTTQKSDCIWRQMIQVAE